MLSRTRMGVQRHRRPCSTSSRDRFAIAGASPGRASLNSRSDLTARPCDGLIFLLKIRDSVELSDDTIIDQIFGSDFRVFGIGFAQHSQCVLNAFPAGLNSAAVQEAHSIV